MDHFNWNKHFSMYQINCCDNVKGYNFIQKHFVLAKMYELLFESEKKKEMKLNMKWFFAECEWLTVPKKRKFT